MECPDTPLRLLRDLRLWMVEIRPWQRFPPPSPWRAFAKKINVLLRDREAMLNVPAVWLVFEGIRLELSPPQRGRNPPYSDEGAIALNARLDAITALPREQFTALIEADLQLDGIPVAGWETEETPA
jgi:hypothetical protein